MFEGTPIVVGVDGSPESIEAARLGWELARQTDGPCRFVHGVEYPLPDSTFALGPVTAWPVIDQLLVAARSDLERALAAVVPPEAVQALDVRVGRPARVLAQAAAEHGAGMVVIGGKHHGAVARAFGGSTAHQLIRVLDVPVLVTSRFPHEITRILVGVDLSEASTVALDAARSLSWTLGGRLRAVHVVEPVVLPPGVQVRLDTEALYRHQEAAFAELMAGQAQIAPGDRITRRGRGPETLAEEAASWEADLLVVGSHGKGWVDRLLVGSTTERLLNLLPTSLLVVPAWLRRRQPDAEAGQERHAAPEVAAAAR